MDNIANGSRIPPRVPAKSWHSSAPLHIVAVVAALTSFALYEAVRLVALSSNNIWWHLRTGQWILEEHTVPRSGLFSQSASLPWIDLSWGFQVLTAVFFRYLGFAGLPALLMCLQIASATALFMLALSASRKLWYAVVLCAVAQFCLMPVQLDPALASVGLLAVELILITRARSTESPRPLYWLPLVFIIWVNIDRQFIVGMLTLAIFCLAVSAEGFKRQRCVSWPAEGRIKPSSIVMITGASFVATFVSPYTWRVYSLAWQSATDTVADRFFRELHSLRFRQPQDYALMLLTMTAFFVVGRRRSRDLFMIALLVVSTVLSFRTMRESWFVVVCSVAIIGCALRGSDDTSAEHLPLLRRNDIFVAAALVLLVMLATLMRISGSGDVHGSELLLTKVEEKLPLQAAEFIRSNHLPEPIFNTYDWGGFLTFALPEYPVSIDGRTDLYGGDLNAGYFRLMQGEVPSAIRSCVCTCANHDSRGGFTDRSGTWQSAGLPPGVPRQTGGGVSQE